jgi:AraC family transcriptional regulator
MKAEIVQQPEMRVAAVPHKGAYMGISDAFEKLGSIAGPAGLFGPDTSMIALYHDDPQVTPEKDLRSDAAVTVKPGVSVPKGLTEERVPAGRYARTTHVGPYETLPDAWAGLMSEWLPKSGERMGDGVSCELYRNDPSNTPKEKLITELYVPLK